MANIEISREFAKKHLKYVSAEHLQVYVCTLYLVSGRKKSASASEVAAELGISEDRAKYALDFWTSQGELSYNEKKDAYSAPKSAVKAPARTAKPSYSMDEIDAVCGKHTEISEMLDSAEHILNTPLTPSLTELLFSFVDWLGLPPEVIIMLLTYAEGQGKTGKRYLETVAINWADMGIDNYERAEAHVRELEAAHSREREIRSLLGIYDRALSQTERKYIKSWETSPMELISLAYDKTVTRTGKLSYAYMDRLLQNWAEEGITTPDGVKQRDEEFKRTHMIDGDKQKASAKKSKFNNYDSTEDTDYAKIQQQLQDMLYND